MKENHGGDASFIRAAVQRRFEENACLVCDGKSIFLAIPRPIPKNVTRGKPLGNNTNLVTITNSQTEAARVEKKNY